MSVVRSDFGGRGRALFGSVLVSLLLLLAADDPDPGIVVGIGGGVPKEDLVEAIPAAEEVLPLFIELEDNLLFPLTRVNPAAAT